MSLPYPYITDNPNNLNTGSYLNEKESELFVEDYASDFWYGLSGKDVIEVSLFDLDQNQIGWTTLNTEKNFRKVDLSYLNTLNQVVSYSYFELLGDFILYKNEKILVNPIEQVSSSFGISSGSYIASYNFVREMAGTPTEPLVIKDISPSRKEIKLIPLSGSTPRFRAFCLKKFQIKDVSPLLIQKTNGCPYDQIYSQIKHDHVEEITYLKNLLFLPSDGQFLGFLRSLYEDVVDYTNPPVANQVQETIKRIQGIRSYFQHHLLSNYETISDFIEIDNHFDAFTVARIDRHFVDYGPQNSTEFIAARQFLIDFFTTYFYHLITLSTKESFDSKYYSFFQNALNFGDNQLFSIIDHAYADERVKETEPLTLLVKLKEELPDDIKIQNNCWVTNVSLTPFVVNIIFKTFDRPATYKISEPNFALESDNLSLYNINTQYTAPDLEESLANQQTIDINKKIGELFVDYTDFSNFIIFSSAKQRIENFKTKVMQWTGLSSSLVTLNASASQAVSVGTVYPYYASEKGNIDGQMSEIVDSFDGYESYLFSSGSYQYDLISSSFYSSSYVEAQDETALYYDKTNRDSFINNTPEHIVLDEGNDDYLTFLMMAGHYFDNIYLYITNLPSEKMVDNDPTKTFSKKVIDYTLDSFGWKLGVDYEDTSILDAYTTSSGSLVSAEDRTKAIRTRLLSTLPQIYKTKGTDESIRLLLACHGVPSDLLSIREYGGDDFNTGSIVTYSEQGKAWLFALTGSKLTNRKMNSSIVQDFTRRANTRTAEFKGLFNNPGIYPPLKKFQLASESHYYKTLWDSSGIINLSYSYAIPTYQALGYYSSIAKLAWSIGAFREHGSMGRFYAELGSGSLSQQKSKIYLTSSLLPIFDGEIFNVMLRRRDPSPYYQYTENLELVPAKYDLIVQRNEGGRVVWKSKDTMLGDWKDNMIWSGISSDEIFDQTGSYLSTDSSYITWGTTQTLHKIDIGLGNMMIWDAPVSDADFDIHCNDFNSFAFSGSDEEKHLITRLDVEEPYDPFTVEYGGSAASGYLSNKAEYYPTFLQRFSDYIASGSWNGSKTGSLNTIESLSGSLSGSVSGSMTGTGSGWLSFPPTGQKLSYVRGEFTGSQVGLFSDYASGSITGSSYTLSGIKYGKWTGSLGVLPLTPNSLSSSYFTGSFSGSASGSFFGTMTGSMWIIGTGFYSGYRSDPFTGSLLGNLSGSMRLGVTSISSTGSYDGKGSGSVSINDIGTFIGTYSKVWYGQLTGSSHGAFTGSAGFGQWTGSTRPRNHYYGGISAIFTGSFKGFISSSNTPSTILVYATGSFSGSFFQEWTGSITGTYPIDPLPYSFLWNTNQWQPINAAFTPSIYPCNPELATTTSLYPYQFFSRTIEKSFTAPKYGPNRFKNKKIKSKIQTVEARLDDTSRSTYDDIQGVPFDSNLLGLYLDPQDAKNKDIVRFLGNYNVIDLIGDPGNQYSASYINLQTKNEEYNSFGDRRVLYNELITLFKIYFNRSVFDAVKNVLPARASARTGILIEPTVLERPKYQHRKIFSESDTGSVAYFDITASHYFRDSATKLVKFSGSAGTPEYGSSGQLTLLYGEFNTIGVSSMSLDYSTLPNNLTIDLDVSYINEANFGYPINYDNGYYSDILGGWQLGNFSSLNGGYGFPETIGNFRLDSHHSNSFSVKQWDKYTIYFKSGSHTRNSNKAEDTYVSTSVWLYKIVEMSADGFNQLFYTSSFLEPSKSVCILTEAEDIRVINSVPHYLHRANTAKCTPNQSSNLVRATELHIPYGPVSVNAPYYTLLSNTYFEPFGGYPRNHYTHTHMQFSPISMCSVSGKAKALKYQTYIRNRQTDETTIGTDGLSDGTLPVESIETSNVNLVKSDNVINQ